LPQSPTYIPLEFKYAIEVTSLVPATSDLSFLEEGVMLVPYSEECPKPWRWWVLMDEKAFLEDLKVGRCEWEGNGDVSIYLPTSNSSLRNCTKLISLDRR
jgi:hypothetical protein